MKANIQTDHGEVVIDTDVIAKYAGAVAVECFGVVGMATTNVMEGITSLLKKENLSQGITVNVALTSISSWPTGSAFQRCRKT